MSGQRAFVDNVRGAFGARGEAWLGELPELVRRAEREFGLEVGPAFEGLSFNWVAPGRRRKDGAPVVLKLGCDAGEVRSEREALEVFRGDACVELYEWGERALVLERLWPEPAGEGETLEAALGLMGALHRPAPQDHGMATVGEWCQGLARYLERWPRGGPMERAMVERAWRRANELLSEDREQVVLHGDLHHGNVMRARGRGWCAIDPKGVVGERAYEVCALLRNPPGFARREGGRRELGWRVDLASEVLGVDRARLVAWGWVESVLSQVWCGEGASREVPMAGWYEFLENKQT